MKPVNDIPGCAVKEMKEKKKEEEDERERERSAYNRTTEEEEEEEEEEKEIKFKNILSGDFFLIFSSNSLCSRSL